jgi:hypothetical protein
MRGWRFVLQVLADVLQNFMQARAAHGEIQLGEVFVVEQAPGDLRVAIGRRERLAVVERQQIGHGFPLGAQARCNEAPIAHQAFQQHRLATRQQLAERNGFRPAAFEDSCLVRNVHHELCVASERSSA